MTLIFTDIDKEFDKIEDTVEWHVLRHPKKSKSIIQGSSMTISNIALTNESTVLTDDQVAATVPDLQTQVVRDFAPAWGFDAKIVFVPKTQTLPDGFWQLVVLDDSDQAGALGYHDLTPAGLPMGKVFARTDLQNNLSWTVTVSHELLEMLGDPMINTTCQYQDNTGFKFFMYEACDACESDQYAYTIGKTKVSDFVYPSFFGQRPNNPGVPVTQFDFQNQIKANVPTALARGSIQDAILPAGYLGFWTPGAGWSQVTGRDRAKDYFAVAAPPGSRRERRTSSRDLMPSLDHNAIQINRHALNERLLELYPES